jgi:hypothetical protein
MVKRKINVQIVDILIIMDIMEKGLGLLNISGIVLLVRYQHLKINLKEDK